MNKKEVDWDISKIEEFKKDYVWMGFDKLEQKYGFSKYILQRQAKFYGVVATVNKKGISRLFSPDQIKEIIAEYNAGKTSSVIGDEKGCSGMEVRRILADNGVPRRTRRYFFDEHYFDVIDSTTKAYFLGFAFANSAVDKNGVSFTQSAKNREILENLKKELKATNPIVEFKSKAGFDHCTLLLMSTTIGKALCRYGLNKRPLGVVFPTLPVEYYAPFLQGYFEGNGSVIQWAFKLTGTRHIVARLQNILMKYCALYPLKREEDPAHPNYTVIGYHGIRQIKRIFKFVYSNSPYNLTWKYLKFKEIINSHVKTESAIA
jgi:hypothetical protein